MSEQPRSDGAEPGLIAFLATTTVALVTSMAMIGPTLKLLAIDLGVTVGEAGQLGTVTSLPWALTALLAGLVIDRRGPRSVLAVSLLALGLATCASAAAPSFAALLALRALMGLVGGAAPAAINTIVADRVAISRRGRAIGWVYSGFPLAAAIAVPALAAGAGVYGWRVAFAFVGAVLVGLAVTVWLWVAPDAPRTGSVRGVPSLRVLAADRMWLLVVANVLERLTYASFTFYLATFLMDAYALESVAVALPLSLTAAGALAGNVVGGQLADRGNRALVFAATMTAAAVFAGALFAVDVSLAVSTALGCLFGLANAASRPAFMTIATSTSPQHRGAVLGIISSTSQVGWALGAAFGGVAFEAAGAHGLAVLAASSSLLGALVILPLRGATVQTPAR